MDTLSYERLLVKLAATRKLISKAEAQSLVKALNSTDGAQEAGPLLLERGLIDIKTLHQLHRERGQNTTWCGACGQTYVLSKRPPVAEEREGKAWAKCAKCGAIEVALPESQHALIAGAPIGKEALSTHWEVLNERPRSRAASTAKLARMRERRQGRVQGRKRREARMRQRQQEWAYAFAAEERDQLAQTWREELETKIAGLNQLIHKEEAHGREENELLAGALFRRDGFVELLEGIDAYTTSEAAMAAFPRALKQVEDAPLDYPALFQRYGLTKGALASAEGSASAETSVDVQEAVASQSPSNEILQRIRGLQHELLALDQPLSMRELHERFEPLYEELVAAAPNNALEMDELRFFLDAKSKVARAWGATQPNPPRIDALQSKREEPVDQALPRGTTPEPAQPTPPVSAPVVPSVQAAGGAAMPSLSAEEALARIEAGEEIRGASIPLLVLSQREFKRKLVIEGCEIGQVQAEGVSFKRKVSFKGCTIATRPLFASCTFGGEVDFKSVRFSGGADFKRVTFERKVSFNYASFPQHATLTGVTFKREAVLSNINFDRGIDISGSSAEASFGFSANTIGFRSNFSRCNFEGSATFSNTVFTDVVDFSKCRFASETKLFGTTFNRVVKFNDVAFDGPALFVQSVIEEDANFTGASFARELRLDSARSRGAVRLDQATLKESARLTLANCQIADLQISFDKVLDHLESWKSGKLERAAGEFAYLKRNYQQQTDYDSEDRAYYMQRSLARKCSKPKGLYGRLMRLLEILVLDWGCGYGTKPVNILWTVGVIWALFAGFFWGANTLIMERGGDPLIVSDSGKAFGPLAAALFSFKWFINAEIGDHTAVPGSWIELVVMAEVALGYAMLFLLVATFTRKVAR